MSAGMGLPVGMEIGNKTPTWEWDGKVKVISKQDIAVSS